MTPAEQAMAAAWISEMWAPVREVPREERAAARALADDAKPVGKVRKTARRKAS